MGAQSVIRLIEYKNVPNAKQPLSNAVEESRLMVTLQYNGLIAECTQAVAKMLGRLPQALVRLPVSWLLPQLKNIPLMKGHNLNPYLHFLTRIGYQFQVLGRDGAYFLANIFFCEIGDAEHRYLRVIICPLKKDEQIASQH